MTRTNVLAQNKVKPPHESETAIKRHIMQYLRLQGFFCWVNVSTGIYDPTIGKFRKLTGYGMMRGTSDILGVFKKTGKLLAIEIKTKSGKVSPEQEFFLSEVNRNGGIGFVARSVEEVIEKLKDL